MGYGSRSLHTENYLVRFSKQIPFKTIHPCNGSKEYSVGAPFRASVGEMSSHTQLLGVKTIFGKQNLAISLKT